MSALTTYGSNNILDATLRHATPFPAVWYCALYTTLQDASQTGTECADASYARQPIAWNAASSEASTNNGNVTFPAFAGTQTLKAVGIADALVGGNCWIFENLQISGTNLVVDASTNTHVAPDGYTPVSGDIGSIVTVTGGPHWTVGTYTVLSISSGKWVLSASPAAVNAAGGIWKFNLGVTVAAGSSARVADASLTVSAT